MAPRSMARWLVWITVFGICLTPLQLATAQQQTISPESSPKWVRSSKVVDLAWFYKPATNVDVDTLYDHFDSFILTRKDEAYRDELIAKGAHGPIYQYLRFEAIQDPGDCNTAPWQNQVAYEAGDFCDIDRNHPDWFLLDSNGKRIGAGDKYWQMDPGNSGWRAYLLERTQEMQEAYGWKGVFYDNIESSLGKFKQEGIRLKKYPDAASYTQAVYGLLEYLSKGYFQPQGRPLAGNVIFIEDPGVWYQYLDFLDGAMDEGWAVDWSTGYYSPDTWQENLERAEETQKRGKTGFFVSQGAKGDDKRQEFAFASYLLISIGRASFRYADYDYYDQDWHYANYDLDLGRPLGTRYQDGNVWKRDFTGGSVTVDPVKHTAKISQEARVEDASQPPTNPDQLRENQVFLPLTLQR